VNGNGAGTPAKTTMNLQGFRNQKGTERLATPKELAEFGGAPTDPMTEAQILDFIQGEIGEDLKKAAEESAAQAKVTAMRELAAALDQDASCADEKTTEPDARPLPELRMLGAYREKRGASELSEPDRVAAAFFGEEEEGAKEFDEVKKVQEVEVKEAKTARDTTQAEATALAKELADRRMEVEAKLATAAPQEALAIVPVLPAEEAREIRTELLAVAEALDQHRLWVESGGKEGIRGDFAGANLCDADLTAVNLQGAEMAKVNLRGADLSMANLRGANLVEADLRETNLLGTEFSGANMMGANLYGAQGLWAGRLGGANLFDATLPEAVGALDGGKTIAQFTQSARRFYVMVMVLCGGACALVAMTTDVRLLLDESVAPMARIPNILPLKGFYLGAPLLLTLLYLRLQFLLLRVWGSIGALPAVFSDGQTPEKDGSWYLMGPIRPYLRWTRDPRSPLAIVECAIAKLLAYWAVPVALFVIWLRYLVMQDYRGTLLHVFLLVLVAVGALAMPRIVARVLRPGDWTDESTAQFLRSVLAAFRAPLAAGLVLFLLSLGVIRGLPGDASLRPDIARGDMRRWASTAFQALGYRPYADVTEESVSGDSTKQASEGDPGTANGPRLNEVNLRYSRGYRSQFAGARMWRANLEGASLSEADFTGANLREAALRGANLDHLHAAKANLVSGDAQGALFAGADFRNADLSYANLDGATLTTTNFERATLYAVRLRHADLLRANLGHADLRDVRMDEAVLSLASLEQTDLSAAKLMGANLTSAQAKGTIFLDADLSKADLRGATFPGAILRQAKLDGAQVEGADFRGALGLEAWQVCSMRGWRGAQFDADVKASAEQTCAILQGSTRP